MPTPARAAAPPAPHLPRDPCRRLFLKVGAGFSAAIACSALLPALTGCSPADTPPHPGMAFLRPADVALFRALLPAVAIDLQTLDAAGRGRRIDTAVKNIDGTIAAMGQNGQHELRKLLDLLASTPLRWALAGLRTPWAEATPEEVTAFLARWRGSRFATLNAGGVVLVKLASVAYFVLPYTWAASGYPGPNPAIYRALHSQAPA
ncbi:hypothetical protein [Cupriavidus pauculus]|uniref:Twin-arginine translocation pathway signal protein n=1 Tax=Cupriavidus pauculus TaxID=82633 RepID=A0A2N5CI63_9BURK|nr:hypothetical protein [Cupriavidus pauculus]PLQ01914.1 hypothetical protein CYJ10_00990 [Cupriavidus pauculus]